jgi:putative FmdB family regulatory protein
MPIYEYECRKCGRRTETLQNLSAPPLTTCEVCGGELKKLISSPAFQFKGSGWYATDYARKDAGGGSSKKEEGGTDAKESTKAPSSEKSEKKGSGGSEDGGPSKAGAGD